MQALIIALLALLVVGLAVVALTLSSSLSKAQESIRYLDSESSETDARHRNLIRIGLIPGKYLTSTGAYINWGRVEQDTKNLEIYEAALRGQEVANVLD